MCSHLELYAEKSNNFSKLIACLSLITSLKLTGSSKKKLFINFYWRGEEGERGHHSPRSEENRH